MKRCPRCGLEKSLDDFHRNRARRDGRQSVCKACRAALDHERYMRTRGTDARRIARREFNRGRAEWLRSLKAGKPCHDCGHEFPPEAMQWDHLPQYQKGGHISQLRGLSKQAILGEIAKCELVCTNCHTLRTAARAGWRLRETAPRYGAAA